MVLSLRHSLSTCSPKVQRTKETESTEWAGGRKDMVGLVNRLLVGSEVSCRAFCRKAVARFACDMPPRAVKEKRR
jgi:hypothetical protein